MMTTKMAMGDDDDNNDGNGATGDEVNDYGDGVTLDDDDNDDDGMMGNGAMGYNDDDDGC